MVASDNNEYGPAGVVFVLMSLLIVLGVVIIVGAVVGLLWQRGLWFRTAVSKVRRVR